MLFGTIESGRPAAGRAGSKPAENSLVSGEGVR
jgi:hypothetical protein